MTNERRGWQWLAALIPGFVLCVVVVHHFVRVSAQRLTPWKGGGFGMFSTIDYQPNRSIRLYVVTEANDTIRVGMPAGYERALTRARLLPRDPSVQILVNNLARALWVMAGPADENSTNSVGPSAPCARMRLARSSELKKPDVRRVAVSKVVIEIYTIFYERGTHRLSTRLLSSFESAATR